MHKLGTLPELETRNVHPTDGKTYPTSLTLSPAQQAEADKRNAEALKEFGGDAIQQLLYWTRHEARIGTGMQS